ncbi:PF20097 family protein [Fuerstiella marisgermanici]|uniref:PF20097 family protein n=1 Tax=Fuerstiella marisgermanici TaxID=1891926 RepID=UPI0039C8BCA3
MTTSAVSETEPACPFCSTPMDPGFAWIAHIFAGGLVWQRTKPELAAWRPSPGQTIIHSHIFNESRSLRPAFRCPECESITIQPNKKG